MHTSDPSLVSDVYTRAATTYVDTDGRTFMFAFNWIRETDPKALNWVGPKHVVAS